MKRTEWVNLEVADLGDVWWDEARETDDTADTLYQIYTGEEVYLSDVRIDNYENPHSRRSDLEFMCILLNQNIEMEEWGSRMEVEDDVIQ